MKKIEFRHELSNETMNIYTNSSLVFYQNEDGTYYYSESYGCEKNPVGTLEDVEELLKAYA